MMRLFRVCLFLLFGLSATVVWADNCTITTTGLAFGSYNPASTIDVTGNGSISINCSDTTLGELLTGFTVTVDLSQGSSGSYAARTLKMGAQNLNYNLYIGASATGTVFGNGTASTGDYNICYPGLLAGCSGTTGNSGQALSLPVYGRLPAGQDVSAGLYGDSVIATVTF